MSKALESALEAVRRMAPGSEVDPVVWRREIEALRRAVRQIAEEERADTLDAYRALTEAEK